jgi:hypothetical protein
VCDNLHFSMYSASRPAILTEVFRDFPQYVVADAGIVPEIKSRTLPYI